MSDIGIIILATNAYFALGIRFIKKFTHHYKGNKQIKFYFYSDTDPQDYLPDNINIEYYYTKHDSWVDGTNSKFINIISLNVWNCRNKSTDPSNNELKLIMCENKFCQPYTSSHLLLA